MGVLPILQALQKKAWERFELTETQQRMYAAEKQENFRWISKLVANYSAYELTEDDLIEKELCEWLKEVGQFAEVVYASLPLEALLKNYDSMAQPGFPLEGYYALSPHPYMSCALPLIPSPSKPRTRRCESTTTSSGAQLLKSIKGKVAKLPAAVFSRWIHERNCYTATDQGILHRGENLCKCTHWRQQIIISICGTCSLQQAIHDLRAVRRPYPGALNTTATVHAGFWDLYQGMKSGLMEGIQAGLRLRPFDEPGRLKELDNSCVEPGRDDRDISRELVVTGHSMGGAIAHLLCIDLLTPSSNPSDNAELRSALLRLGSFRLLGRHPKAILPLPRQFTTGNAYKSNLQQLGFKSLQIVTYGEPRTGNQGLVDYWVGLKRQHQDEYGIPIQEWCIKAYKDGVPVLPPIKFGYRHFSHEPLYTANGKVYRVPSDEREFALFRVAVPDSSDCSHHSSQTMSGSSDHTPSAIALYPSDHTTAPNPPKPLSPLGGHNYYNERDLEGRYLRRMEWLGKSGFDREGWEERYRENIKVT